MTNCYQYVRYIFVPIALETANAYGDRYFWGQLKHMVMKRTFLFVKSDIVSPVSLSTPTPRDTAFPRLQFYLYAVRWNAAAIAKALSA